jgi:hypothetical protein
MIFCREPAVLDEDVAGLLPAIAPPAMNRFGTLVSNVSMFSSGASVTSSTWIPALRIRSTSGW